MSARMPITLNLTSSREQLVFTWSDAAFSLQAAPFASGPWTNVPGATSPFTNSSFNISMNHSRPGGLDSNSGTGGDIFFSVSAPTPYSASGTYTAVDPNPRHVNLDALLLDLTTNQTLLNSHQRSIATPNESFTLGEMGGDTENTFTGSLTGNLVVGHQYKFTYQGQTYANSSDDGAADGCERREKIAAGV